MRTTQLIGLVLAGAVTVTSISIIALDKMHESKAGAIKVHINEVGDEIERGAWEGYVNKISSKNGLKYHIDRTGGKYAVFLSVESLGVCKELVRQLALDKETLVVDGNLLTADHDADGVCQISPVMVSVVRNWQGASLIEQEEARKQAAFKAEMEKPVCVREVNGQTQVSQKEDCEN